MAVRQIINNKFQRLVADTFPVSDVKKGVEAMAVKAIDVMRERTNQGYDVNGKRFAKYSKSYEKYKKKYIRSGSKVSEFGASKMPSHIRLSGALFSAMTYDIIQYYQDFAKKGEQISTSFRMRIKPAEEKKVAWLLAETGAVRTRKGKKTYKKASRDFFGLSDAPSRASKERDAVIGAFIRAMKFQVGGSQKNMTVKTLGK